MILPLTMANQRHTATSTAAILDESHESMKPTPVTLGDAYCW